MSPKTRELIGRFQSSGLTQQAFCRKNSIPITTLQYHLAQHRKGQAHSPLMAPTFVPLNTSSAMYSQRPVVVMQGRFSVSELIHLLQSMGQ
jgi:hypothetical protein